MRRRLVVFAFGIAIVSYFPVLPSALVCLPLLLVALSFARSRWWLISPITLGLFWGISYGYVATATWLDEQYHGANILLRGVVSGLPKKTERGTQFEFLVESASHDETELKIKKVLLTWYGTEPVLPGQSWQLETRLKKPRGTVNPGGFDSHAWLLSNGIDAKGYVRNSKYNQRLSAIAWQLRIATLVDQLRFAANQKIGAVLKGSATAGLVLALVTGDKQAITTDQWQFLQRTGTIHLMVISGLHIGFIAMLCYGISGFFWRRSQWLLRHYSAQQYSAVSAIIGAVGYAAFAGFTLPTQRAVVMVVTVMFCQLVARKTAFSIALCYALVGVLLLEPLAPQSNGFWLSFGAVAVLLYGLSARLHVSKWQSWLKAQGIVFIGLAPLLIYLLHSLSLIAPLANMIAIPVVSFIVVPLALIGTILFGLNQQMAEIFLGLADQSLALLWQSLTWLVESIGYDLWQLSTPASPLALILATLGVGWLLAPKGFPARWLGVLMLVPLFFPSVKKIGEGEYQLTVLDVGQGLAIIIETANHLVIYDTGPGYGSSADAGDWIVLPFLKHIGKSQIDHLIVSHSDNDHAGGALSLIDNLMIKRISAGIPQALVKSGTGFPIRVEQCVAGEKWQWNGVVFEFMHPDDRHYKKTNNQSCVLKISNGFFTALLPGDIENPIERKLVADQSPALNADLLIAAHHGSKTSSSYRFIKTVSPEYVVYSTGFQNSFNHPHKTIVKRFTDMHSQQFNTAELGAISFYIGASNKPLLIESARESLASYWYSL